MGNTHVGCTHRRPHNLFENDSNGISANCQRFQLCEGQISRMLGLMYWLGTVSVKLGFHSNTCNTALRAMCALREK